MVIHAPSSVLIASSLYFTESKKDRSFFFAFIKGFTLFTVKLFLKLLFKNNLFKLIFFFFEYITACLLSKKIYSLSPIFEIFKSLNSNFMLLS